MSARKLRFRLRLRRLQARLSRIARRRLGLDRTVYVDQRLDEYRNYWAEAAHVLGAEFVSLTERIWEVRHGERRTRMVNDFVQANDPVILQLTSDKAYCARVAEEIGVPMPQPWTTFRLDELDRAQQFAADLKVSLVVKPARDSDSGRGVTTYVRRPAELEQAMVLASIFCPDIIVQRMLPGETCRLLFLDGACVHAVRRRGVRVRGDGRAPICDLLVQTGLHAGDSMVAPTLAAQQLSLKSVPAIGEEILVLGWPAHERSRRELRTVYDEAITGLLHPRLVEQASLLLRALGSEEFAGVDLVTVNPSLPLEATGGALLEVNAMPGIHHHYVAAEWGQREPIAATVVRYLLSRSTRQM